MLLHLCDSGENVFALIADTGVEIASIRPDLLAALSTLFLQINFVTALSSRFSIALSSAQTVVMTYSDDASHTNGAQVYGVIETLLDKCRALRALIADMSADTNGVAPADAAAALATAFGKFA